MRIVIALGGNALLHRGERPDAAPQLEQVAKAAAPIAALAHDHEVVIVHGNGPQVGLLALESAADESLSRPYPLGDLVAETQGLIGYWLQQAISRTLAMPVVTLVSQTVVEADDPAFANPTKFVGSVYDELEAKTLATEHDWTFARDGEAWRRVVASPAPVRVVETATAELLLRNGVMVVLAGGGGVPVIEGSQGLEGIEAVVDKDLVAALVAEELQRRPVRRAHRRAGSHGRLRHAPTAAPGGRDSRRTGPALVPCGLDGTEDRSGLPVRHRPPAAGRRRFPRRGRRSCRRYGRDPDQPQRPSMMRPLIPVSRVLTHKQVVLSMSRPLIICTIDWIERVIAKAASL